MPPIYRRRRLINSGHGQHFIDIYCDYDHITDALYDIDFDALQNRTDTTRLLHSPVSRNLLMGPTHRLDAASTTTLFLYFRLYNASPPP
jgi:hypothetical protein